MLDTILNLATAEEVEKFIDKKNNPKDSILGIIFFRNLPII